MSDRTVPFDPEAACDSCGALGAYDFMGDLICGKCMSKGETMKGGIEVHIGLTVEVEPEGEHTYVRIPQIPGLHVLGKDLHSMADAIAQQIRMQLENNHSLKVDWLTVDTGS